MHRPAVHYLQHVNAQVTALEVSDHLRCRVRSGVGDDRSDKGAKVEF